jgi:hypothetical protein
MKKKKTKYRLTWESNDRLFRKEMYFIYLVTAETWYDEKLAEGKNPELWMEQTTTTFEELRPQQQLEES